MIFRCLFEQSGTLKNVLKNRGFEAYDYDIENNFDQTDFQLDLFSEIENCFNDQSSVFDSFYKDDILFCFFPCTYFSGQNNLFFQGLQNGLICRPDFDKVSFVIKRSSERERFFNYFCKLYLISLKHGFRCIIENPYTDNFLLRSFPVKPTVVISNRRLLGDSFEKPTMFYFVNIIDVFCLMNPVAAPDKKTVVNCHGIDRSIIQPEFFENFLDYYVFPRLEEVISK